MNEGAFYKSMFDLVEHVGKMQLNDTSKHLILSYLQDAKADSAAERARRAIGRYIDMAEDLPTLADIRARSRTGRLSPLDHLVLKMEHAASRLG